MVLPPEDEPELALPVVSRYSLFSVEVPAMPSAFRPFCSWKDLTAVMVPEPKSPSTVPE